MSFPGGCAGTFLLVHSDIEGFMLRFFRHFLMVGRYFLPVCLSALLIFVASCSYSAYAETAQSNPVSGGVKEDIPIVELMERYGGTKGADCMRIDGAVLGIARVMAGKAEARRLLRAADIIVMLSLKDCAPGTEEKLASEMVPLLVHPFEKVAELHDEGSSSVVWAVVDPSDGVFREIIVSDSSFSYIIYMKGRFTEEILSSMSEGRKPGFMKRK